MLRNGLSNVFDVFRVVVVEDDWQDVMDDGCRVPSKMGISPKKSCAGVYSLTRFPETRWIISRPRAVRDFTFILKLQSIVVSRVGLFHRQAIFVDNKW